MKKHTLIPPITLEAIKEVKAGDFIEITGTIYTARDTAHKRLVEMLDRGEALPFDLNGSIIYYAGPTPAKSGEIVGSIGPTTSYRMDAYTPRLLSQGLKITIGKGNRSREVRESLVNEGAIYCAAYGGAGAYLSTRVKKMECIAFSDLGPEGIYRLEVEGFPVTVIDDMYGNDLYEMIEAGATDDA